MRRVQTLGKLAREGQLTPSPHSDSSVPPDGKIVGLRSISETSRNLSMNDLHKLAQESSVSQRDVVDVFGESLQALATENEKLLDASKGGLHEAVPVFQGRRVPKVSLKWYLWRLVYYLNKFPHVEPSYFADSEEGTSADFSKGPGVTRDDHVPSRGLRSLLYALVYIDRIAQKHANFAILPSSIHRIILTAMLIAVKFTDDFALGVDIFAKLGGIKADEMRKMEITFCELVQFEFNINEPEFEAKCMKNLALAFDIARNRRLQTQSKQLMGSVNEATISS